ncbi:MAG TPA: SLC13 family permease [Acidobacteriota bacterium]|nr:SLC13 family permease [Acidobacteriota bacterium]
MEFLAGDRIQIIVIFLLGFLASRLFVRSGLAEWVVMGLIRRVHRNLPLVSLFLLLSATLLSSFIPNVITTLTLLPALLLLIQHLTPQEAGAVEQKQLTTYLACSLIWGSNIGGNASVIGSPANLVLLFFLEVFQVPGGDQVGFLTWLTWGLPLVLALDLAAWLLGMAFFRKARLRVDAPAPRVPPRDRRMNAAIWASALTLLFSAFLAVAGFLLRDFPGWMVALNIAALAGGTLLSLLLFSSWMGRRVLGLEGPLLDFPDLWSRLPWRGLALVAAVGVFFVLTGQWAERSGFNDRLTEYLSGHIAGDTAPLMVLFLMILATIFLTEFLSNTLVATAFLTSAAALSPALGLHPLPLFVGIGMASTCAFMSPIATPVNSLAFGEIRQLSLWRFALAGLALNLIGAVLLTLVCGELLPWLLDIPLQAP